MASQPLPATQSAWWRLPRVIEETGLSRSTIYRLMDRGEFPRNKPLRSARAKVWLETEVRAWKDDELGVIVPAPQPQATGVGDLL